MSLSKEDLFALFTGQQLDVKGASKIALSDIGFMTIQETLRRAVRKVDEEHGQTLHVPRTRQVVVASLLHKDKP